MIGIDCSFILVLKVSVREQPLEQRPSKGIGFGEDKGESQKKVRVDMKRVDHRSGLPPFSLLLLTGPGTRSRSLSKA